MSDQCIVCGRAPDQHGDSNYDDELLYHRVREAWYAMGLIEKGAPEDDDEAVTDFRKYLRGYAIGRELE